MLTKNVWLCCNSNHIFLLKFNVIIEGKERPAKTKLFPAKLCAVLDTFGSAVNFNCWLYAMLAICWFSKYFRNIITYIDPKSPGNWSFRKSKKIAWLHAVLYCAESDSAQYRITLRGVRFSANIFAKTNFLVKPF